MGAKGQRRSLIFYTRNWKLWFRRWSAWWCIKIWQLRLFKTNKDGIRLRGLASFLHFTLVIYVFKRPIPFFLYFLHSMQSTIRRIAWHTVLLLALLIFWIYVCKLCFPNWLSKYFFNGNKLTKNLKFYMGIIIVLLNLASNS